MHRSKMTIQERRWRSRLCQWLARKEMLRGTLSIRERGCGKAACRCAKGSKHVCLVLERSHNGKHQQLYVPKLGEEQVRRWVMQYQDAKELLEKVAQIYWEKAKKGDFKTF